PDNVTTTFSDLVPDEQLGTDLVPTFTTAGAAAALLQNVAVGNPTVTKRYIYRTKAGGNAWLYVGSIDNNTETTFIDDKAETDLGRPPVATSTIGALAGDTSVVVKSAAGWPSSGWFNADSQVIRYTSISRSGNDTIGDTLQGIPPLLAVTSIG